MRVARTVSTRRRRRTKVLARDNPPRDCRRPSELPPTLQVARHPRRELTRVSAGRNFCETPCRTMCTRKACDPCALGDESWGCCAGWSYARRRDICAEIPPCAGFCEPPGYDSGRSPCRIRCIWRVFPCYGYTWVGKRDEEIIVFWILKISKVRNNM